MKMSGDMKLSQEEIDALLGQAQQSAAKDDVELTEHEKDALGEIGNISFGSAATSLSTLLNQRVEITTPTVSVLRPEDVSTDFPRPYVLVSVGYTSGLSGTNVLAVELDDAKTIADLMLGGDGRNTDMEFNELHLSAVAEAMNQMMGGAATAMSQLFGMPINISPPTVKFVDMSTTDHADLGFTSHIVNTAFRLRIGDLIDSKLMQLVPVSFAKEVLQLLGGQSESAVSADQVAAASVPSATPAASTTQTFTSESSMQPVSVAAGVQSTGAAVQPGAMGQFADPLGSTAAQETAATSADAVATPQNGVYVPAIQRPEFVEFTPSEAKIRTPRNLALLFDVNLNVTVELGRTQKSIREILDLAPGSVVELDKLAGEPVDILVNNKRIAIGEVVVIDENFGVRVTDIIDPVDRVKHLQ
jgi:flagellar motor switch protein FliN